MIERTTRLSRSWCKGQKLLTFDLGGHFLITFDPTRFPCDQNNICGRVSRSSLCHDGCRSQTSDVVGQLRRDTATHSPTFRKPSMAYLKAFDLNYILSHRDTASDNLCSHLHSHGCSMGGSTARSLPTQAFRRTNEDFVRAQTSQGWICLRSGAKNRAQGGDYTSSAAGNKGEVAAMERYHAF